MSLSEKQKAFFESLKIEYNAVIDFIDRLYKYSLTKKFDKAPDPSKFIVYNDESDEDEENIDKTNDQEKESDE